MPMTPSIAAVRKRKKIQEAASTAAMITLLGMVVAGVSWADYQYFDFAEPWVRVVGITLAWIALGLTLVLALRSLGKSTNQRN